MSESKSSRTWPYEILSAAILATPAAAIWYAGLTAGWENVLVFWSCVYVPAGILLNLAVLWAVVDSEDRDILEKAKRQRTGAMAFGFAIGGAWMIGAAYRGWFWTAALLALGWVLGPCIQLMVREGARKQLVALEEEEEAA